MELDWEAEVRFGSQTGIAPPKIAPDHYKDSWIHDGMVRERAIAMLSGFFGFLAALLDMIGLYGVISYLVASRRNEIGVRLALGARRSQVEGIIVREAWQALAIGIAIGVALSLIAGYWATSLLFGLKSYDPLTLVHDAECEYTACARAAHAAF